MAANERRIEQIGALFLQALPVLSPPFLFPDFPQPPPPARATQAKVLQLSCYSVLAQSHNTSLLPPPPPPKKKKKRKKSHRHCFRFLLGHLHVPGEIANNDHAKFWGVKEVYYGICASRE